MPKQSSTSVLRVEETRWHEAQEWERALWQRYQQRSGWRRLVWPLIRPLLVATGSPRAHRDDWNHWWAKQFDGYGFLPMHVASLLELGCGPYTNARLILRGRTADRVVLSDPLIETYVQFKENWLSRQYRRGAVEIDKSPAEDLPFENESFEVVAMINVLDHVRDARRCVERAKDVVRGGGYLLVGQDLTDAEDKRRSPPHDPGHPIRLNRSDIEPWLFGFKPVFLRLLPRAAGRNPAAHYATLLFAGVKASEDR